MSDTETEMMINEAASEIKHAKLRTAFEGYFAVYFGDWGLKASEEDAVFSMLKAVDPEKYADADYEETMRDDPRMVSAMDQVYDLACSDPWKGDSKDAERFIREVLGIVVAHNGFNDGDRVELTNWVERFPSFQVPPGSKGVVTDVDPRMVTIKMDDPIKGCEEWDNEVQFCLPDEAYELLDVKVIA